MLIESVSVMDSWWRNIAITLINPDCLCKRLFTTVGNAAMHSSLGWGIVVAAEGWDLTAGRWLELRRKARQIARSLS
jgi:hypothetical protein